MSAKPLLLAALLVAPMVLGLAMADDGQSSQVAYDAEIHPDSDLESADLSRLQDGSDSGLPVSMIVPPCADGTCDLSLILNLTPERMSNQITFFLTLGKGSSYEEDNSSIHTYITVANSQTDGWESWDTLYSADGLYIGQSLTLGLAEHNYIEEGSLTINIRVWNDQAGQRGSVVLAVYEIGLERVDSAFECEDGRARAVISIGGWPAQHGQGVNLTSTDGTSVFYQGVSGASDFEMNQFSLAGEEEDIASELQQAIEHPSGHGGSILVSRTLGVLNLTQALPGASGNTQVISDMPSVWQDGTSSNYFSGGCSDGDGDGVIDLVDQCPNTSATEAASVNDEGCAWSQLDPDGDGVPNSEDTQPTNPLVGNVTGGSRFGLDGDHSGVINVNGTIVNVFSCDGIFSGHIYIDESDGGLKMACSVMGDPPIDEDGNYVLSQYVTSVDENDAGVFDSGLHIDFLNDLNADGIEDISGDFNGDGFADFLQLVWEDEDGDGVKDEEEDELYCGMWIGLDNQGSNFLGPSNASAQVEPFFTSTQPYGEFAVCGFSPRYSSAIPSVEPLGYSADIDNDGFDDVIVSSWKSPHGSVFSSSAAVGIYYFSEFGVDEVGWKDMDFGSSITIHKTYVTDYDNDGDLDISVHLNSGSYGAALIIENPWFPDEDSDGVADPNDSCPGTLPGEGVDSQGCALYQLDGDGDGVDDGVDLCSGTPAGLEVNEFGCNLTQTDSDSDGLSDAEDNCPGTPSETIINIHGCSQYQQGTLVAWGEASMTMVPAGSNFIQVDASSVAVIALRADGSIVSWGNDIYGVISGTPTGNDFVQVQIGVTKGLALKRDGSLVLWGDGMPGWEYWMETPEGTGFEQISLGYGFALALRADGSIVSWGKLDVRGVHDTYTYEDLFAPTGTDSVQVSAPLSIGQSGGFRLSLRADGTIYSWFRGGFGDDSTTTAGVYHASNSGYHADDVTPMPTGAGFTQVSAGNSHAVALREDGSIVSWGLDYAGQVSDTPTGTDFVQVSAGVMHTVALREDGSIISWGADTYSPSNQSIMGQVSNTPDGTGFMQVAAGDTYSIAIWNGHPPDSDQDGVLDSEDDCPNTPDSESVDDSGCAVGDVADPDSDDDGVRDSADSCPGTAGGSVVDSQGCALSQGGVDTGGGTGGDTGGGTSEESSGADDPSLTTMLMMGCIAFIALLALISRMAASEPTGRAPDVSASVQNEYKQAQRLQKTLGSTMQENDGLRREREQLTRLLRSSDLTETENRILRNELSTMQSVMGENDEMAREMVAELEELRGALAEERAAAKEASAEYRDSVHQGDNVGQKVESQTINDADAIARIALESYKQALKDMGKED